jgi:hypothetical protein
MTTASVAVMSPTSISIIISWRWCTATWIISFVHQLRRKEE